MGGKTHAKHAKKMERGMKALLYPRHVEFRSKSADLACTGKGDQVLDFGCGVGLLTEYLADRVGDGGKVTGVDIGEALLETAKERLSERSNVEFQLIGADGKLPFDDSVFDAVTTNVVLHLLDKGQKDTVLGEFKRVLKPGGRLMLAEFGKVSSFGGWWISFQTRRIWVWFYPYEKNSVDHFAGKMPSFVEEAGFEEVEVVDRMKGCIDFIVAKNPAKNG